MLTDLPSYVIAVFGTGFRGLSSGLSLAIFFIAFLLPSRFEGRFKEIVDGLKPKVLPLLVILGLTVSNFLVYREDRQKIQAITNHSVEFEDRRSLIDGLSTLMNEANKYKENFEENGNTAQEKMSYLDWYKRCSEFLLQFDPSYVAQFQSAPSSALGLAGRDAEGNGYWSAFNAKEAYLSELLSAARSKQESP